MVRSIIIPSANAEYYSMIELSTGSRVAGRAQRVEPKHLIETGCQVSRRVSWRKPPRQMCRIAGHVIGKFPDQKKPTMSVCTNPVNYDISQHEAGIEVRPQQLAKMVLDLQDRGCHKINFVTP